MGVHAIIQVIVFSLKFKRLHLCERRQAVFLFFLSDYMAVRLLGVCVISGEIVYMSWHTILIRRGRKQEIWLETRSIFSY